MFRQCAPAGCASRSNSFSAGPTNPGPAFFFYPIKETELTHQIYAIECRDDNGSSKLIEVEEGVCYYIGERAIMQKRAAQHNRWAKRKGFNVQWRAVPLPYTTSLPDWFDYS
jgi:hypothetical protein